MQLKPAEEQKEASATPRAREPEAKTSIADVAPSLRLSLLHRAPNVLRLTWIPPETTLEYIVELCCMGAKRWQALLDTDETPETPTSTTRYNGTTFAQILRAVFLALHDSVATQR